MSENQNKLPEGDKKLDPDAIKALQSTQLIIIAGAFTCPISLFLLDGRFGIFGILAALSFAILALYRLKKLERENAALIPAVKRMRVSAYICLAGCIVALILQILLLIAVYPVLMEAIESGDFSAFGLEGNPFEGTGITGGEKPPGSLTWG